MIATQSRSTGNATLDTVVKDYTRKVETTAEEIDARCAGIDLEMERIRTTAERLMSGNYLTVEDAREQLIGARDERLAELAAKKAELQSAVKFAHLDAKYKRIDLSFMSRFRRKSRKQDIPLPAFVMYSVDNPVCELKVECWSTGGYHGYRGQVSSSTTPALLSRFWGDIIERLQIRARKLESKPRVMSVRFGLQAGFGANKIPDSVREKIVEARPLFDHIYLLAEAPAWDYELKVAKEPITVVIRRAMLKLLDPLVVGEKAGYFWQIDLFDLTPSEAYLKEFTYKL